MGDKRFRRMSRRELVALVEALEEERDGALPEEVRAERERLEWKREYHRTLRSTVSGLLVVAAVAALLATFFLALLRVTGSSMEPTLQSGDVVLLLRTDKVKRGDICGFYFENKLLLKRVIGEPGDWVDLDSEGTVRINGAVLEEPYVQEKLLGECDVTFPYQVPDNHYFVLGDQRKTALDSRNRSMGCVNREQVAGRVLVHLRTMTRKQK